MLTSKLCQQFLNLFARFQASGTLTFSIKVISYSLLEDNRGVDLNLSSDSFIYCFWYIMLENMSNKEVGQYSEEWHC